jgi:hypothetical protein
MAKGDIKLHHEHGLNPTLCMCFWCGQDRGDIALLGASIKGQAPTRAVIDYQPCDRCEQVHAKGVVFVELVDDPPTPRPPIGTRSGGPMYPTGRWVLAARDSNLVTSLSEGAREDALETGFVMCNTEYMDKMLELAAEQGVLGDDPRRGVTH